MQLALSPSTPGLSARELVDLVIVAEEAGYSAAWLAEVAGPEAMALAGAIAGRTQRMDLGIAVVPASTRSPALLAMGAATVSSILGGRRFDLGIGASSELIVESWHGRTFDPALKLVEESVRATRAALAGERSFEGETTAFERFRLAMPPHGPVGLFIGALGPKMLRLAGAVADGVCLNLMTPEAVGRQMEEITAGATAAGREVPDDFGVMARFHVVLTDDRVTGVEMVQSLFGPYFAQPVYNRFLSWMGFEDEARSIRSAFAAGDRAGVAAGFHAGVVESVALVGTAGRIRERLDEYFAAGVQVGALNIIAPDAASTAMGLRALAPGV